MKNIKVTVTLTIEVPFDEEHYPSVPSPEEAASMEEEQDVGMLIDACLDAGEHQVKAEVVEQDKE